MAANLDIVIKATNSASPTIKTIGSDLRSMESTASSSLAGFGRNLDAVGKKMQDVGGNLTKFVSLPLTALGGVAIKFSTDFNASMANVASLGLLPERVVELKKNVQDMAVGFGQSTKDLSEGLYQVVSAFGDSSESATLLEINAKAAAAGLATVSDSVNLTSAVTKGYGDTSQEAVRKVSDLAFQTVKLGQTTFPELASSMGKVVPLAASLGVESEILFAQMATLTGVTGNAAEVSTQLRATYQALMKPTADMASAIATVAMELDDQGRLASGPLVEAWQRATDQWATSHNQLANLGTQLLNTSTETEEGAKAAKILEKAIKDQENAVKKNKDAMEEAAAALGGAIVQSVGFDETLQLLTATTEGNTNTLGKMFGSVESVNAVLALTGGQADTFKMKLAAMGQAAGATDAAFAAQTEGINKAGFTMQQVKAQVEVLMQRLGDGLAPALYDVLEAVKPLIDRAVELATKFAGMDKEQQRLILTIGAVLVAIGPALTVLGTLTTSLSAIISVSGGVAGALTGAGGVAASLGLLLNPIGLTVAAVGGLAVAWATDFGGIRTKTTEQAQYIGRAVADLGQNVQNSLSTSMNAAQSSWRTSWANLTGAITSEAIQMRDRAGSAGQSVASSLSNGVQTGSAAFRSTLSTMAGYVRGVFEEKKNDWLTAGRNVAYGIQSGVTGQSSSLYSSLRSLGSSMLSSFKSALGIRSPSTLFAEAGYNIAAGLAVGIGDGGKLVDKALSDLQAKTEYALKAQAAYMDKWMRETIQSNAAAVAQSDSIRQQVQGLSQAQYAVYWQAIQNGNPEATALAAALQTAAGGSGGTGTTGGNSGGVAPTPMTSTDPFYSAEEKAKRNEAYDWMEKLGVSLDWVTTMDIPGILEGLSRSLTDKLRNAFMDISKAVTAGDGMDKIPDLLKTIDDLVRTDVFGQVGGSGQAALSVANRQTLMGFAEELKKLFDEYTAKTQAEAKANSFGDYWQKVMAPFGVGGAGSSVQTGLSGIKTFIANTFGIDSGSIGSSMSQIQDRIWGVLSGAGAYGQDIGNTTTGGVFDAVKSLFSADKSTNAGSILSALSELVNFRNISSEQRTINSQGQFDSFGKTTQTGNTFNITFTGTAENRQQILQDIAFLNSLYGGATP